MAKEEMLLEEKRELQYTLQELALNIERQDAQIRHLTRTVAELGKRFFLSCDGELFTFHFNNFRISIMVTKTAKDSIQK